MNISELSIRRPVLSTVLTLIILLFGLIGYSYLGVREYPSVDNPIISVSCSYPGAKPMLLKPDYRTIGAKHQWYPGNPFLVQCQPTRFIPYYGRI